MRTLYIRVYPCVLRHIRVYPRVLRRTLLAMVNGLCVEWLCCHCLFLTN